MTAIKMKERIEDLLISAYKHGEAGTEFPLFELPIKGSGTEHFQQRLNRMLIKAYNIGKGKAPTSAATEMRASEYHHP